LVRLVVVAALAGAAGFGAALGTPNASAALSHDQVIRRGDNICYDATTRLNAAKRELRPFTPFRIYHRNLARLAFRTARIGGRVVDRFERLIRKAPADGEKWRLKAYVRGLRNQIPRLRRLGRSARAGNKERTVARAYVIERYTRKYRRHARRYGFRNCGYE
jgi:hypothetical protein